MLFTSTGLLKEDNFPLNTIVGNICTLTIIEEFQNPTKNYFNFSIKPKVILLALGSW